ncbi:MAG: S-adenosyl-l-methionine hydroxide adenosyltransferase family protein [Anaerolineales bacterium]
MSLITLTTDFGQRDGFVGIMKGVILGIFPQARLIDLSHEVEPQNVRQAAYILQRAAPFFPNGTVHLAVVDPGVGTERRTLAARLGEQFFVGPDNGLITLLLARAESRGETIEIVHLDRREYWLTPLSSTFHGRDIFAPCAAYLARGVPLRELGTPIADPIRLSFPSPERQGKVWKALIVYVDRFGNLITNFAANLLGEQRAVRIYISGYRIEGIAPSYAHRPPGSLVAVIDSDGFLEIALVNDNAAHKLGLKEGDVVEVECP